MEVKLIDAYLLLEAIRESREKNPHGDSKIRANHTIEHDHIAHLVLEQPVAYDVDKVVERLKERQNLIEDELSAAESRIRVDEIDVIKEIVKVGGVNE